MLTVSVQLLNQWMTVEADGEPPHAEGEPAREISHGEQRQLDESMEEAEGEPGEEKRAQPEGRLHESSLSVGWQRTRVGSAERRLRRGY